MTPRTRTEFETGDYPRLDRTDKLYFIRALLGAGYTGTFRSPTPTPGLSRFSRPLIRARTSVASRLGATSGRSFAYACTRHVDTFPGTDLYLGFAIPRGASPRLCFALFSYSRTNGYLSGRSRSTPLLNVHDRVGSASTPRPGTLAISVPDSATDGPDPTFAGTDSIREELPRIGRASLVI